jgi:hypothetical protein
VVAKGRSAETVPEVPFIRLDGKTEGEKEMKRPNAAQQRKWGRVFGLGCMACLQEGKFTFGEIHHARHEYGNRNHNLVFSLCPAHHRPTAAISGVLSRHGDVRKFREKYGGDKELYEKCMELLGEKP